MAESMPGDITGQGKHEGRENFLDTKTTEGKPQSKRHTVVSDTPRETKQVPQKFYGRRNFHNAEFHCREKDYCEDYWNPEGRENGKRSRHPHRYWQSRNGDHYFNGESEAPRQYHQQDRFWSGDSHHHKRGGKRSGHKTTDSLQTSVTQDGTKERKKTAYHRYQYSDKAVTDKNGETIINKKPDMHELEVETEVSKTEQPPAVKVRDHTVDDFSVDKSEEKVKRKLYVNKIDPKGPLSAGLNQTTNGPVTNKSEQKVFKKKRGIDVAKAKAKRTEKDMISEVSSQNGDNSDAYAKRKNKIVKKKIHVDKSEVTKTDSEAGIQSNHNPQHRKDRKQNEPVSHDDKVADEEKNMTIMVGKYQLKKFKPISPDAAVTEHTVSSGTSNSKVLSDKTVNQIKSTHSHKKWNKKGGSRHYVASLQSDVLSQQLTTGQYECMVCCDRVRVKDPVWSCSTCYHIFHLKCIKKWAKIPTNLEEGK